MPVPNDEEDAVVVVARRALPMFAKNRQVDVVLDHDRRVRAHVRRMAAIGTSVHPGRFGASATTMPAAGIDCAGRTGADGQQSVRRHIGCAQQRPQISWRGPAAMREGSLCLRGVHDASDDQVAAEVRYRESGASGAEIDGRDEPVPPIEFHVSRAAPASRRPGAEVGEEARADQRRGEAADGRRREPRGFDELGAGERTFARHRGGQHALEVQPSQVGCVPRALHGRSRACLTE